MANLMGRNIRSVTGRNLRLIKDETGLDPWTASAASLKNELEKGRPDIPNGEEWRIPYLEKLLEQRQAAHYGGFEEEEMRLAALIDSLCVN